MSVFRLSLPMLLVALAAGCTAELPAPQSPSSAPRAGPPQAEAPTAPGQKRVASLTEIAGEWDIVRFDGHSPPRLDSDGQRHAYVNISPGGLNFSISCNHSGMAGLIRDGVLQAAPADQRTQTAMGCGPEREARDDAFFGFFRARPQVGLLPDGRLKMATADKELLLEKPAVRRLAMGPALPEITGSWRVISFMRFEGGGHRGWGAMYAPGKVRIADSRVSYSRCPASAVRFNYTPDFVLRRQGDGPAADTRCPGAAPPATEVELMLVELLNGSPEAERVNDRRFILRTRDYAVLLAGEADYQREFGDQAAEWERRPG